jgi:hypothetical protein
MAHFVEREHGTYNVVVLREGSLSQEQKDTASSQVNTMEKQGC